MDSSTAAIAGAIAAAAGLLGLSAGWCSSQPASSEDSPGVLDESTSSIPVVGQNIVVSSELISCELWPTQVGLRTDC